MSIYRFSDASLVKEVRFFHADNRVPEALLEASDKADAEKLAPVKRAIEAHGWQAVPVFINGKDYLQVRGFSEAGELSAFLMASHFASGNPHVTAEEGDAPSRSASEWLKHSSLKAAGWLNLIGDVSLLQSGLKKQDGYRITGGALYTAGAGVLALYGNAKTEKHLQRILRDTAEQLRQQAGDLPADAGLFAIAQDKRSGALCSMNDLFTRYPADVMLGAYTLGAVSMLLSGLKKRGADGKRNPWDIAYGASSISFKAASLLIPEKQRGSEAEGKPMHGIVQWIQEKPLRIFGFGSLVTDSLLGLSALREYRTNPKQQSHIFTFITTGTYLMADVLMAMSNKDHANADGKLDENEQRRVEAYAADAIARMPRPLQGSMILKTAELLAGNKEMRGTQESITQSLTEQVEHMSKNPWSARISADTATTQPKM